MTVKIDNLTFKCAVVTYKIKNYGIKCSKIKWRLCIERLEAEKEALKHVKCPKY